MNIPSTVLFRLALCVLPLAGAGCAGSGSGYADSGQTPPYTEPAPLDPNAMPSPNDTTAANAPANNAPRRSVSNEPKPWESSGSKPTVKQEFPLGEKIPGKTGLVRSPYARYAGEVDVKGIASGTQVKCPYTGKIFIVP